MDRRRLRLFITALPSVGYPVAGSPRVRLQFGRSEVGASQAGHGTLLKPNGYTRRNLRAIAGDKKAEAKPKP